MVSVETVYGAKIPISSSNKEPLSGVNRGQVGNMDIYFHLTVVKELATPSPARAVSKKAR